MYPFFMYNAYFFFLVKILPNSNDIYSITSHIYTLFELFRIYLLHCHIKRIPNCTQYYFMNIFNRKAVICHK